MTNEEMTEAERRKHAEQRFMWQPGQLFIVDPETGVETQILSNEPPEDTDTPTEASTEDSTCCDRCTGDIQPKPKKKKAHLHIHKG
jgi:hypothetical protein